MKQLTAALGLLCFLAACGVDGAPTRPEPKPEPQSSITLSGSARVGVAGKL